LQDEVIERIVFALSVKLTQKEKEQLARKYTENLEAYDYYLSGAQALYSYSVKGLAKARSMFQKAIDLDPKFAQAYAAHAMASSYIFRYSPTVRIEDDRIQAFEFATKALALDSSLPMAHTVLAGIHIIYRRFDEAITSADKAVDLDPNNADSHVMRAHVLTHIGRHEESQKALNTAFRLNPNPPPYYYFELGLVQFNLKQYAEAIKSIKKSGDIIPDWLRSRVLAPSYAYLGRLDEARAELKKIVKVAWNFKLRYVSHPYVSYRKLEEDDKHWYEGFRRAGLQDPPDNYRRSMDDIVENMLSGKEIKDLAVGRTWSGFNPGGGDQWWISFTNDGKLPTRGAWGIESGSYRIEEFRICWKWQEPLPRQDGCGFVYPNPKGTVEEKNQYEWVTRYFVHPFSIEE
jgi:adenylate cyclase